MEVPEMPLEEAQDAEPVPSTSGRWKETYGFTDGREFRIRALNAAGSSGWSNVVRPFQQERRAPGPRAVSPGAQAGNNTIDKRESVHVEPKTWRRRWVGRRHPLSARQTGPWT